MRLRRRKKLGPHPVIMALRKARGIYPGAVLVASSQPVLESLDGELAYEVLTDLDAPPGYVFVMPDRCKR